jgi:hypothetical protein
MASTPESKVKAKAVKQLKAAGAYWFFPATHGYGRSGVPDIIVCYRGKFIAIECKAGKNKPTALQNREMQYIGDAGGVVCVVDENNVDILSGILKLMAP